MYKQQIRKILNDLSSKKIDIGQAMEKLKFLPFEDLGFAKIDHHRSLRRGFPEAVFCQNKTKEQVVSIIKRMVSMNSDVIATRASIDMYKEVKKIFKNAQYNGISSTITIKNKKAVQKKEKSLLSVQALQT